MEFGISLAMEEFIKRKNRLFVSKARQSFSNGAFRKKGDFFGVWRRVFFLPQSMSELSPVNAEFNNGYLDIEMS